MNYVIHCVTFWVIYLLVWYFYHYDKSNARINRHKNVYRALKKKWSHSCILSATWSSLAWLQSELFNIWRQYVLIISINCSKCDIIVPINIDI